MKPKNVLVREVPPDILRQLEIEAAGRGIARDELIKEILAAYTSNTPPEYVVVGYIEFDPSKLGPSECEICHSPAAVIELGSDSALHRFLCQDCRKMED